MPGLAIGISLILCVALACSGSDDTASDDQRSAVVSDASGNATLTIPAGTDSDDVTVTEVPLSDVPASIEGAIGSAYRLSPSGREFDEPVTFSLKVSASGLAGGSGNGFVPMFGLVSVSEDGTVEPFAISETEVQADGSLLLTGKTDHFSWIVRTDSGLEASLRRVIPSTRRVGTSFDVLFQLESDGELETDVKFLAAGALATTFNPEVVSFPAELPLANTVLTNNLAQSGRYTSATTYDARVRVSCATEGAGRYTLETDVDRDGDDLLWLSGVVQCVDEPEAQVTVTAPPSGAGGQTRPAPGLEVPGVTPQLTTPVFEIPNRPTPTPTPASELEIVRIQPAEFAPGAPIVIITRGFAIDRTGDLIGIQFATDRDEVWVTEFTATANFDSIRVTVPDVRFTEPEVKVAVGIVATNEFNVCLSNVFDATILGLFIDSVDYTNQLSTGSTTDIVVTYSGTPQYPIRVDSEGVTLGVIEGPSQSSMFTVQNALSCSRPNTTVERDIVLLDARGLLSEPVKVTITCT